VDRTAVTATPVAHAPVSRPLAPGWLAPLHRIDGIGSAVVGLALLAAPGWLQAGLGPGTGAGIRLLGGLFVVNAWVNLRAVAPDRPGATRTSAVVDLLFGVGAVTVAVLDPSGAATWARWLVAALGVVSLDLAAVKAWGAHRTIADADPGTGGQ
jgi:hypothetical protein